MLMQQVAMVQHSLSGLHSLCLLRVPSLVEQAAVYWAAVVIGQTRSSAGYFSTSHRQALRVFDRLVPSRRSPFELVRTCDEVRLQTASLQTDQPRGQRLAARMSGPLVGDTDLPHGDSCRHRLLELGSLRVAVARPPEQLVGMEDIATAR